MTSGSNDDATPLAAQLRALAAEERGGEASSSVEARVMRAWDEHHETMPASASAQSPFMRSAAGVASSRGRRVALAAAAVILLSIVGWTWPQRHASPAENQRHALAPSTTVPAAPERDPPIAAPVGMSAPVASGTRRTGAARPRPVRVDSVPASGALVVVGAPITTDEEVSIVRVRVDRDTLAGMGLRPVAHDDGAVEVELIVGEDGVARGLRLGP